MIGGGTIYGVALNDTVENAMRSEAFNQPPYRRPPQSPVVYIKPRTCLSSGRALIGSDVQQVVAASTVALLFSRDVTSIVAGEAMRYVGAMSLALDLAVPTDSYHRPPVRARGRDGYLPLGDFVSTDLPNEIETWVDDELVHRWSLDRLIRSVPVLIADLSSFMTLRSGDILLVGIPGDAPRVAPGRSVCVRAGGMPRLDVLLEQVPG